ncbi:protein ripply1 [Elephas maximus indicus]|uniref:protein ripply1 n=1 Tax=Elephas maximus indicus TaxID=99487 RepID=UPI002116D509|nr:protein ripply1 [Elephas maximus indicus]XP_049729121.1 protein ripply1 [Elephas maximus indicus]
MDPATPVAAASAPALALAKAPAQDPLAFPGLLSPLPLLLSGQEVHKSERGTCLWRPWLFPTSDLPRQHTGGATAAEVTKADSKFHHPVRLFWPKSRSFDYLYSDGEILLQNFPVQATINLYEDSDSEDEKEEEEEEDEEEEEKEKAEECVRVLASVPCRATAHPLSSPPTCLN